MDENFKIKLNYLKEKGDFDWTSTFFYLKLQLKHASFFLHFKPMIRFENGLEFVGNNKFDVILIGSDDGEHVVVNIVTMTKYVFNEHYHVRLLQSMTIDCELLKATLTMIVMFLQWQVRHWHWMLQKVTMAMVVALQEHFCW
jgi:hypothetical protein